MELHKVMVGKKIVFVHPPDIVSKHLMQVLAVREFEVYSLLDHSKIKWISSVYPETIFFINIDAVQSEEEWELFLSKTKKLKPGLLLGVFSFKISEPARISHYVMDLGVSCGFIQLKQGVQASSDMMLKILEANEARGRRKYLRYKCEGAQATLNLRIEDNQVNGRIRDISSVGMAFVLESRDALVKNQLIKNIQLRLKGVLVNTNGVIMGSRSENVQTVYVLLFQSQDIQSVREKIHSYIQNALQKEFEEEFS